MIDKVIGELETKKGKDDAESKNMQMLEELRSQIDGNDEAIMIPEQPFIADQCYYLPTASLKITATAQVTVLRSITDNSIIEAILSDLTLDTTVAIEPDTSLLLGLNYNSFSFANDELRLNVNSSCLLEGVSVVTEDRLSNIIAEISEAPKKILSAQAAASLMQEIVLPQYAIAETTTYKKIFIVTSDELQITPIISKDWIIAIDGITKEDVLVDATFEIQHNCPKQCFSQSPGNIYYGILTRPLFKLAMQALVKAPSFNNQSPVLYNVLIPDPSIVIEVPIQRSSLVKRTNTPKFSNGLLVENYIVKPSEFESFVSIPINILKAIFSIPAQLLNFKITHVKQLTELENANRDLNSAIALNDLSKKMQDVQNSINNSGRTTGDLSLSSNSENRKDTRNELMNEMNQLKVKKNLLEKLSAVPRNNLFAQDIENINNLIHQIQLTQTKIDDLRMKLMSITS
ncbi:hypothetical protein QTN47_21215 [Danxiaibacter flavus]|uniref:DUF4403 family protein n=2 Tax=Danxiaibacter flavus TaxID=3049108 RepID=A0ABV3ZJQ3_9BACT|nr:hypothetical protein QNM32_21220 [Chitinophagaceae bacterium DXS]